MKINLSQAKSVNQTWGPICGSLNRSKSGHLLHLNHIITITWYYMYIYVPWTIFSPYCWPTPRLERPHSTVTAVLGMASPMGVAGRSCGPPNSPSGVELSNRAALRMTICFFGYQKLLPSAALTVIVWPWTSPNSQFSPIFNEHSSFKDPKLGEV